MGRAWVYIMCMAVCAGAAVGRPVPSAPWTPGTTPPVNLATVDLFLKLEPVVQGIEEEQDVTIEEVNRSHLCSRKERVAFRLQVLEERLEANTGVPLMDFARLKARIIDIHKILFTIERLQEDRRELLQIWKLQLEHDTAPDELFVERRMHIDEQIADLSKLLEAYPPEARAAVQTRYKRILRIFHRPKKLSRAERRERQERANELLPQPPANPYRQDFFEQFW